MSTDTADTCVVLTDDRIELLRRRVRQGATLLDRKAPGWWERFDFARLDIMNGNNCVAAQVFGSYWGGMIRLFGDDWGCELVCPSQTHGFNVNGSELARLYYGAGRTWSAHNAEASALKDHWMAEVRSRADTAS